MFKTHLKKIIVILLVTLAFGSLGIKMATGVDGPKEKSLSLDDAINLALKNNPDVEIAKLNAQKAQIEYNGALKTAHDMKNLEDKSGGTYETGLARYVNPKACEVTLVLDKKREEIAEKSMKLNVEKAYYDVLKADNDLQIKQKSLNYFQDQLKIAQTAYEIGTKAKVDLLTLESAVAGYQAQVIDAENTYNTSAMELNRIIGLDLDTPLKLTSQFTLDKVSNTIKLDDAIKTALSDNLEILSVKKNQELQQVKLDMEKRYYGAGVSQYDINAAGIDTKIADASVRKQELATTALIKQSYRSLSSLETMIDWQKKEVAQSEENARILALKYKAGLATSLDVKKANIDLDTAEKSLSDTIYNYNLLKSKFKYDLFFTNSAS